MVLTLFLLENPFAGEVQKGVQNGVQELDATRVRLLPGSPFYDRQELHRKG